MLQEGIGAFLQPYPKKEHQARSVEIESRFCATLYNSMPESSSVSTKALPAVDNKYLNTGIYRAKRITRSVFEA